MPIVFKPTDITDIATAMIQSALNEWRMELALRSAALEEARLTSVEDMDYGGAAATADQTPLQEAVDHAEAQVERLRGEARKRKEGIAPLCVRDVGSQQPTPSTMSPI